MRNCFGVSARRTALFISYSRRDNAQGRITELVERIKQDFASFEGMEGRESRVFFDQDEIHGMSDWRQRILQGLRESRLLLACLSPAYLQSEYCEWEFVEYPVGHRLLHRVLETQTRRANFKLAGPVNSWASSQGTIPHRLHRRVE